MIGGEDMVVPNPGLDRGTLLEATSRIVSDYWPRAVIEDPAHDAIFRAFWNIPFALLQELMIYRDEAARKSWNELGADESNRNAMIHLIVRDEDVTFVVDDGADQQIAPLLVALRDLIAHGLAGSVSAELREAA